MYVAIFIILSVGVTDALIASVKLFMQSRATAEIRNSGTLAIDRIVREIRTATSVEVASSVFDVSPGTLVLNSTNEDGTAKVVSFSYASASEGVEITDDGTNKGSLVSENVRITNMVFRYGMTYESNEWVRAEITLQSKKLPLFAPEKFYGTAILRGGY